MNIKAQLSKYICDIGLSTLVETLAEICLEKSNRLVNDHILCKYWRLRAELLYEMVNALKLLRRKREAGLLNETIGDLSTEDIPIFTEVS